MSGLLAYCTRVGEFLLFVCVLLFFALILPVYCVQHVSAYLVYCSCCVVDGVLVVLICVLRVCLMFCALCLICVCFVGVLLLFCC